MAKEKQFENKIKEFLKSYPTHGFLNIGREHILKVGFPIL